MAQADLELLVGLKSSQEDINKLADGITDAFSKATKKGIKTALEQLNAVVSQAGGGLNAWEGRALAEAGIRSLSALGQTKQAKQDPVLSAYLSALTEMFRGGMLNPATAQIRAVTAARKAGAKPSASANLRALVAEQQAKGFQYFVPENAPDPNVSLSSASQALYNKARKHFAASYDAYSNLTEEADKRVAIKGMREDLRLMRANKYAFSRGYGAKTEEIADLEVKLEDLSANLKGNTEAVDDNTKFYKTAGLTALGAGMQLIGTVLPSIWAQGVSRNVFASREAYLGRVTAGGEVVGGVAGSVLGGALGSAFGPAGTLIGAEIGGQALKLVGGLLGRYQQTENERSKASRDYALALRKDFYTYGGTGFGLGAAAEQAGLASASSINQMRWTGQTLPGAMAFGMVGEQDMLMLSMMPEYFAALMSGADSATLLSAYQKSVANMPAQLRPLVATMAPGGSQDLYSMAVNPMGQRFMRGAGSLRGAGWYNRQDMHALMVAEGWGSSAVSQAMANDIYARAAFMQDSRRELFDTEKSLYYDPTYVSANSMRALGLLGGSYGDFANMAPVLRNALMQNMISGWETDINRGNWGKVADALDKFVGEGININVYLDDNLVSQQRIDGYNSAGGQSLMFNIGGQ